MYIKPLARIQLLAALSLSATACGTDPTNTSMIDGGEGEGDGSVVECDGKRVGSAERRVRYQTASVAAGEECMAQNQNRLCGEDGKWTEWTGDYEVESCSVADLAACDGLPHGTKQTRDRYELASAAFGEECRKQSQSRECDDGSWSDWSGNYTFERCNVTGAASCDQTPHGEAQTRLRYESLTVPHGSLCRSETQTRDCTNGKFSSWTGTLTAESCRVLEALSCGNNPHGTVEKQTRFEASLVDSGECKSEEQTRTCGNGAWSDWSGTFTAEICDVEGARRCGSTLHGENEKRVRYENAVVPYAAECVSQQQTRVCTNGTFGVWSGTYEAEACSKAAPADCGDAKHGDKQTRLRYATASVAYGTSCVSEAQESVCDNSVWTAWTGTSSFEKCIVNDPADCDTAKHGEVESRTRYAALSVPYGTNCSQETQTRTCQNGAWTAFSGAFSAKTCDVAPPADCVGGKHGQTRTRKRYQAALVAQGATCVDETQSSTCSNGVWGPYSGTFTAEACKARGRSCTYINDEGIVESRTVLDGDEQSRVRYAAPFPSGSCTSETQKQLCTNGTFGEWSGSFESLGCAPLPGTSAKVASCRLYNTDLGLPQCMEYTGFTDTDLAPWQAYCRDNAMGTWDAKRACPTGGTTRGKCTFSYGSTKNSVVQYTAGVGKASCEPNGTWTDL